MKKIYFTLIVVLTSLTYIINHSDKKVISNSATPKNKTEKKEITSGEDKFCTCNLDTIIKFEESVFRVVTNYRDYGVHVKIYKHNESLLDESIKVYGPYSIRFEDFNNDGKADFRLDNQDLNNEITHLFQWNPEENKYINLDSFYSVDFIKPNYFSSINNEGAAYSEVQFYKIENYKPILMKNFYLDLSGIIDGKEPLLVVDQKDSITNESVEKLEKIIKSYRIRVENTP